MLGAAMGSVLNAAYWPAFQKALPAAVKQVLPAKALQSFHNPQILLSPGALEKTRMAFAARGPQGVAIFNQLIEAVKIGLVQGIYDTFLLSVIIMALGLVALFFLPGLELRGEPGGSNQHKKIPETVAIAHPS
jgi:hypothetical protein